MTRTSNHNTNSIPRDDWSASVCVCVCLHVCLFVCFLCVCVCVCACVCEVCRPVPAHRLRGWSRAVYTRRGRRAASPAAWQPRVRMILSGMLHTMVSFWICIVWKDFSRAEVRGGGAISRGVPGISLQACLGRRPLSCSFPDRSS